MLEKNSLFRTLKREDEKPFVCVVALVFTHENNRYSGKTNEKQSTISVSASNQLTF